MQTSPTRLKKPNHIWLARILGFGIVLINISSELSLLTRGSRSRRYYFLSLLAHIFTC